MKDSSVCSIHPTRPASWFCYSCGRSFCEECVSLRNNRYYCRQCLEAKKNSDKSFEVFSEPVSWPAIRLEANFLKRLLAFQIDFILLVALSILLSFLFRLALGFEELYGQRLFFVLLYGGFLGRDALLPGGSPGKRFLRLYVWNKKNDRIVGLLDSVLRNLFIPFFYLDIWPVFFTENQQRAGDLLAGTYVCDEEFKTNERRQIYRLAAVTALIVISLFTIFTGWFAETTARRTSLDYFFSSSENRPRDIESIINENIESATRLKVEKDSNMVTIIGEFAEPSAYYRGHQKIRELLSVNSYRIISDEGPRFISRGPGKRNLMFVIAAQFIEGGNIDGSL